MVQLYFVILLYSSLPVVSIARAPRHIIDVISAVETDIVLIVNETKVNEISWIFASNHIATTWPNGQVDIKNRRFRGRLHGMDGGSLKIAKVTRKDEGTYTANVFTKDGDVDVHPQFHLKVYSILLQHDIDIHANVTRNRNCSLALTCLANDSNAIVIWNYPNASVSYISDRTLHLYDVRPKVAFKCTAENPVSKISKTVTPWKYCQAEGDISQQQMDGSELTWIALVIVFILIVISLIFLYYRKCRSKNVDIKKEPEISIICDRVAFAESSSNHLQKQVTIYAQLRNATTATAI